MPPTAAHLSGMSTPSGSASAAGVPLRGHSSHRWGGDPLTGGHQAIGAVMQSQNQSKDSITIYRAAAAAHTDDTDDNRCEDESDSEEAMSLNGDDSSSGSGTGGGMVPPPPVVIASGGGGSSAHGPWPHQKSANTNANANVYSNPAASLVPSCPCGCKGDDGAVPAPASSSATAASSSSSTTSSAAQLYPDSPESSPIKMRYPSSSADGGDAPLDMSKTSPVYGSHKGGHGHHGHLHSSNVTPPPSPPESDREKFRCLYMLVDAAVGQLEKEMAERKEMEAAAAVVKQVRAQASCA